MLEPSSANADELVASGEWSVDHAGLLGRLTAARQRSASALDASAIERLDTAGALMLARAAEQAGVAIDSIRLNDRHRALFEAVVDIEQLKPEQAQASWSPVDALAGLGQRVAATGRQLLELVNFLGLSLATAARVLPQPRQWPLTATIHHLQQTGLNALPLVALLSFLIGGVVAFLGATVLRDFGAELFVVDLTTYAFLREFGVLLTAILLAGRTASAFTAQIGTMKSREEIDAMRSLGLDPMRLLVLPRLLALLIALPILAVLATLAGLAGGMTVAVLSLDIPYELFIDRMNATVQLRHYLVGLVKAPLFAFVIALVGCLEGFKVAGTAQSVGERTTSAVVQSISLVIVIDAVAAVFFMEIGW